MTAVAELTAWSSTMRLAVDDDRALRPALDHLRQLLGRVERAASRFRPDSELTRANALAGRPVPVSPLLVELLATALDAAATTGGAVDPTVGRALATLGYDRDIAALDPDGPAVDVTAPRRRWQHVRLDRRLGVVTVPVGTALDLGATAKAWTADRAATELSRRFDTGVYVELGGDVAVAGERPAGWCLTVAERDGESGQLVLLRSGGLTTSSTVVRQWRRGGMQLHHIVDPATGAPAAGPWRTASVAAPTAVAANTASTAAIVLGERALDWLTGRGLAARLVDRDGAVHTTPGWPAAQSAVAA